MALETLQRALQKKRASVLHEGIRSTQTAYVAFMFELIGRLLVAGSGWDPILKQEAAGFPSDLVVGFSVIGSPVRVRLCACGGRLEQRPADTPADLNLVFKHISHAFMVFSFQESTPQAFAHQRTVVHGDTALAMRFVRCLNRVQSMVLPEAVARRALKDVPPLGLGQKLALNARLYADVARNLNRSTK